MPPDQQTKDIAANHFSHSGRWAMRKLRMQMGCQLPSPQLMQFLPHKGAP